jgi:hypothetical protein
MSISISITEIKKIVYQNEHLRRAPRRTLPSPAARARNRKRKRQTRVHAKVCTTQGTLGTTETCVSAQPVEGRPQALGAGRAAEREERCRTSRDTRLRCLPRVPTFFILLFGARSLLLSLSKAKLASSSRLMCRDLQGRHEATVAT